MRIIRMCGLAITSVLTVLSAACDSATPFELEDVVGLHGLSTVSGQSVPFVLRQSNLDPSCIRGGATGNLVERINNGVLVMEEDGSFELNITILRICTYPSEVSTNSSSLRATGTFSLAGERVHLEPNESGWQAMDAVRDRGGMAIYLELPGGHAERRYVFVPYR